MKRTNMRRLVFAAKTVVLILFVCNLAALVLVPFLVDQNFRFDLGYIAEVFRYDLDDGLALFFDTAYYQVWQQPGTAIRTMFLWTCGTGTAVILWQVKGVLDLILSGMPRCGSESIMNHNRRDVP